MSSLKTIITKKMPFNERQKKIIVPLFFIFVLLIFLFSYKWLTQWRYMITTDDAYLQGDIATIAPKLNGYIESIAVKTNQAVKKGDILLRLKSDDYQIALNQAKANLDTQRKTLTRIEAQIIAAQSALDEAKAQKNAASAIAANALLTLERAKKLSANSYTAQSNVDDAKSAHEQATANVTRTEAQISTASANIQVLEAQYDEAKSQTKNLELMHDKAKHDLDSTILYAPFDGIVGNLTAKVGNFVVNSQHLASLVPIHALYAEANYKETEIKNIRSGQTAYISVDSFKGKVFKGTVLSVSPATGAVFSLLPPQNATGNFTKITQRIPVRISLPDDALKDGYLRAGMSISVTIDTHPKSHYENLSRQK
ncbi:HlyD family secretion protein [Bartonella ancashensis]|uniref:Multidrug resistance protein A n=1 Tax=Bartonella ancashensis TaxID=1318743 RepID=A0A0M3T2K9_9HYPH|nr:HlyD family secretion protein [Bartonella ancashensis]ALE02915.1 Multidrug resistance protein A [Bartonella ancashensis]